MSHRATNASRGARSSTRSRTRSTACSPRTRSCPASSSATSSRRSASMAPRRSSMTTCARSARCTSGRPRTSARFIGPARSVSSTSGSPRARSRSATASCVRASSSSPASASRGQLDFLHGRENVVLLGPPGTGKTHLAIALSIRACLAGQRVAFKTATEWVAFLSDAQRQGRLDDELDRLQRIPLLVVDEVG
jgi:hypothetical protein